MGTYDILAEALRYPAPGRWAQLDQLKEKMPQGPVKVSYEKFLGQVKDLNLGDWEELYTRTLDLNPPAAPYIGYQNWGDSYQRGSFLSMLNRAMEAHQIDTEGELPDHLIPVLRLMERLEDPFPELHEVMEISTARIRDGLAQAEPRNPYVLLIDAIVLACQNGNGSGNHSDSQRIKHKKVEVHHL